VEEQSIVILDFGSQYTQLIARRIRELKVFSVVLPCTATLDEINSYRPVGIILSGGPSSVYDHDAPPADDRVLALGLPVLGICYGLHFIAHKLGGKVRPGPKREYGHAEINVKGQSRLFEGMPPSLNVWMSHGDEALELPSGFSVVARSSNALAAMENEPQKIWAVQFHPEVAHTPHGAEVLRNFLYRVCGATGDWTPAAFIDEAVADLRRRIGDRSAICALSGGVDSAVAATLVARAIGDRLTCVFVDTGLLRENEAEEVIAAFGPRIRLHTVRAADVFLAKLAGVDDPERKRAIIGEEFIRTFERAARQEGFIAEGGDRKGLLVQGTIYPDVIESRSRESKTSARIKTHHNVGGLPEVMALEVVEPLQRLFKDEVRLVGAELGLPEDILWRHPFPGPGLAVRVVGPIDTERLDTLRRADAIFLEELRAADLYRQVAQAFAVLTPVRSVGVQGDYRTYGSLVALRAVATQDFMTADWARLPYDLLERVSARIVNEVPGVNRVVYDISSKPPATIEWE